MSVRYVQVGWLTVAPEDLEHTIAEGVDVWMDAANLEDYTGEEQIHHSHGPVGPPLPLFVAVPVPSSPRRRSRESDLRNR